MDARSYNAQFLNALIMRLRNLEKGILADFESLNQEQLNWKPNPSAWSVGQILDHLITANTLYFDKFEAAMAEPSAPKKPFKPGWLGGKFAEKMGPDQRKVKVPTIFKPTASTIETDLMERFSKHLRVLETYMEKAKAHDLNRKLASPASSLLRLKIGDAFQLLMNHLDRHHQQALRVKQVAGFPESQVSSS